MHALTLSNIHFQPLASAWIQGAQMRGFLDMELLLKKLGCTVTETEPEIVRSGDTQVATALYNVEFPEGSRHIKRPKERSSLSRTASGRRRRGAKKEDYKDRVKQWSLQSRKGQILVPGEESDYIVTYYARTQHTPMYFDRGVHEVEQDADAPQPNV